MMTNEEVILRNQLSIMVALVQLSSGSTRDRLNASIGETKHQLDIIIEDEQRKGRRRP